MIAMMSFMSAGPPVFHWGFGKPASVVLSFMPSATARSADQTCQNDYQ
jgi:hypothetical protein